MTAAKTVREDQHGTPTGYQYGCRCDACREAGSRYAGHIPATDCIAARGVGKGTTSRCSDIAGDLVRADHDFARVARLANRSKAQYDKYAAELIRARETRTRARADRDEHMAECPAAFIRFGAA